jgi:hypothetical protein
MSGRKQEAFEIIDPLQQQVVAMTNELRGYSARNQALALIALRKKDPKLALVIAKQLKSTLAPGTDQLKKANGYA